MPPVGVRVRLAHQGHYRPLRLVFRRLVSMGPVTRRDPLAIAAETGVGLGDSGDLRIASRPLQRLRCSGAAAVAVS